MACVRPVFPMQSLSVSAPLEHTDFVVSASLQDPGAGGFFMYAVIRTGGKQYRVAPGDVLKIESVASGSPTVEFSDVLAVSGEPGTLAKPAAAKVTAEVLGEGPRRQDSGLPLQAQEAVQEASGTPAEFHRSAHQGHRGRWRHLRREEMAPSLSFSKHRFAAREAKAKS